MLEGRTIYNPNDPTKFSDWMGYSITDDNPIAAYSINFDRDAPEMDLVLSEEGNTALKFAKENVADLYERWLMTFYSIDRNLVDSFLADELWEEIDGLHEETESLMSQNDRSHRK